MHGPMNVKLIYSSLYLLETNTRRSDDSDKGLQKKRGGGIGVGEGSEWTGFVWLRIGTDGVLL